MSKFRSLFSWLATPFFLIAFLSVLLFVELLFRFSLLFKIKYNYDLFYSFINKGTILSLKLFAGMKFKVSGSLPQAAQPIVIISNHQSMFDIPFLNIALAPLRLRFVAKTELARKIPAISIALREGQHALIDRSQGASAVQEIEKMAKNSLENNFCITLFPEGTRSRDGKLRTFKQGGMEKLAQTFGQVHFVPVAIKGAWEIVKFGFKPVVYGAEVEVEILPVVTASSADEVDSYCNLIRDSIEKALRE